MVNLSDSKLDACEFDSHYPHQKSPVMKKCLQCKTDTNNPKFCSRSCSAKFTNRVNSGNKYKGKCKECGVSIPKRQVRCSACREVDMGKRTLSSMQATTGAKSSRYAYTRAHARKVAYTNFEYKCSECGYDKHVEVCRIKSIKDFPEDALLEQVNSVDNLIVLCRNCHWDYDNL